MSDEGGFRWSFGPSQSSSGQSPGRIEAGARLGGYQIVGLLGQGAMGSVYRARDGAGRDVALKVLRGQLDEQRRARFRREGELAARLDHSGVVRVLGGGDLEGVPYLVHELVEGGRDLREVLSEGSLEERVARVRDVALAVGHAHALGIVHRDLKPENVLLDPTGRLRVADFGLARADTSERLTRTGAMLGTPAYMAPEQVVGKGTGPAADVWALGVILYEALCGRQPFGGATWVELRVQITSEEPSWTAEVPRALQEVGKKALRKDPSQRYPQAGELAHELDAWLTGGTPRSPVGSWRPWAGAALALAALCGVGALFFEGGGEASGPPGPDAQPVAASPPTVGSSDEAGSAAWEELRELSDPQRRLQATWSWLQNYPTHPRSRQARLRLEEESAQRPLYAVTHSQRPQDTVRVAFRGQSLLTHGALGMRRWDTPSGEKSGAWFGADFVQGVEQLPDGGWIISHLAQPGRYSRLGEDPSWGSARQPIIELVFVIAVSPDGRTVACARGRKGGAEPVTLLSARDGGVVGELMTEEVRGRVTVLRFIDPEHLLVVRDEDDQGDVGLTQVTRWSIHARRPTASIDLRFASDIAISPDRSQVAISSRLGRVSLRDATTLVEQQSLSDASLTATDLLGGEVYAGSVGSVVYAGPGQVLTAPGIRVAAEDRVLKLFDTHAGTVRRVSAPLPHPAGSLAMSPDGCLVGVGLRAGLAQVWIARVP